MKYKSKATGFVYEAVDAWRNSTQYYIALCKLGTTSTLAGVVGSLTPEELDKYFTKVEE